MKIVGLNYATVEEMIDDINDADLANELVSSLPTVRGFTALVRVTNTFAKTLVQAQHARKSLKADVTTKDFFDEA